MRRTLGRRQPRVQTLEIFRREAAQIGVEGGEVPAGEDPEARGLGRLREGDLLCVPTGRSVLDVLQFSGICADGLLATRDEERRENLRRDLRWHQSEHHPTRRISWKTIDELARVDPSWFCRLEPDETRPIRFAIYDQDTRSVGMHTTLILKRVAGQAQRITFREADTDEINLDDWLAAHVGGDDLATRVGGDHLAAVRAAVRGAAGGDLRRLQAMRARDLSRELPLSRWDSAARDAFLEAARDLRRGELGIERGGRYEAEAFDSLANTAHRCACAARLTTSATDPAYEDLVGLCHLEVRWWVKGSDPADATVELVDLDAHHVAVGLEETDATCIVVRLVEETNNRQPIEDLRVSLAMKLCPQGGDVDDDLLNVARTVELRLENELGRAAREAAQRVALPPVPAMPAAPPMPPAPAPPREAKTGGERRGKKRPAPTNGTFAETVLASVTCPISQSLVVRPVIAEDGKTYERAHIERWLRQKKSSPLTNQRMGTHLSEHGEGRSIVAAAIENGLVDADAAAAWHLASARLKIVGDLPGGLASAKEHLAAVASSPECDREETSLSDRAMLLEAFTLREQVKSFVARAGERGLGSEVVRLLTVDHPSAVGTPMTAWRSDLRPGESVVRIIDDAREFQRLCERRAPGAEDAVTWVDEMAEFAGREFTIEGLDVDDRAYNFNEQYRAPFDACILVRMRSRRA
jgi:hypothetical protein